MEYVIVTNTFLSEHKNKKFMKRQTKFLKNISKY